MKKGEIDEDWYFEKKARFGTAAPEQGDAADPR